MTRTDIKLADLQHIVPAAQPAWIRAAYSYEVEPESGTSDEASKTVKEWNDCVTPVLAFAVARHGIGAYLVCTDSDGPCWCIHDGDSSSWVELHVGEKPQRGIKPRIIDDDAVTMSLSRLMTPLGQFYS